MPRQGKRYAIINVLSASEGVPCNRLVNRPAPRGFNALVVFNIAGPGIEVPHSADQ